MHKFIIFMKGNNDILTKKNIWVFGGKTQDVENSQLNSITLVSHVLLSAVLLAPPVPLSFAASPPVG